MRGFGQELQRGRVKLVHVADDRLVAATPDLAPHHRITQQLRILLAVMESDFEDCGIELIANHLVVDFAEGVIIPGVGHGAAFEPGHLERRHSHCGQGVIHLRADQVGQALLVRGHRIRKQLGIVPETDDAPPAAGVGMDAKVNPFEHIAGAGPVHGACHARRRADIAALLVAGGG